MPTVKQLVKRRLGIQTQAFLTAKPTVLLIPYNILKGRLTQAREKESDKFTRARVGLGQILLGVRLGFMTSGSLSFFLRSYCQ